MKCEKVTSVEFGIGMREPETRVSCMEHGLIDKARSDQDVSRIWEKHKTDVKMERV